jgi:hypothetical protein
MMGIPKEANLKQIAFPMPLDPPVTKMYFITYKNILMLKTIAKVIIFIGKGV